jgi:hypothetical protein
MAQHPSDAGAMTNSQRRNNLVVGCVVALGLFLLSIPAIWFTVSDVPVKSTGSNPSEIFQALWANDYGRTIQGNGLNSRITFIVNFPLWFLLGISSLGVVLLMLNILGTTRISRVIVFLCLAFPGICYLVPFLKLGQGTTVGPGPILALVGTAMGLVIEFKNVRSIAEVIAVGISQADQNEISPLDMAAVKQQAREKIARDK